MTSILYENGTFWVTKAAKGKGYEVYESGMTHSVRRAIIGFEGQHGLGRAIAECDRRAGGKITVAASTSASAISSATKGD